MRTGSLLPSVAPEIWPWLVLTFGGGGVLIRLAASLRQIRLDLNTVALFLGQAAVDFATVLAFFFVVRILVDRVWLRRQRESLEDDLEQVLDKDEREERA